MPSPPVISRCLEVLGRVALEADPLRAQTLFEEALPIARQSGTTYVVSRCLYGLGEIELSQGAPAAAQLKFEESAAAACMNGDHHALARSRYGLSKVASVQGDDSLASLCCIRPSPFKERSPTLRASSNRWRHWPRSSSKKEGPRPPPESSHKGTILHRKVDIHPCGMPAFVVPMITAIVRSRNAEFLNNLKTCWTASAPPSRRRSPPQH